MPNPKAKYHIPIEYILECPDIQVINALYCLRDLPGAPKVELIEDDKWIIYRFYLWSDSTRYIDKKFYN